MDCSEVRGRLSDYMDKDILDKLCKELEKHLENCPECQVEVNCMKRTVELYRRLPSKEVPGQVEQRLIKVLDLDKLDL